MLPCIHAYGYIVLPSSVLESAFAEAIASDADDSDDERDEDEKGDGDDDDQDGRRLGRQHSRRGLLYHHPFTIAKDRTYQ